MAQYSGMREVLTYFRERRQVFEDEINRGYSPTVKSAVYAYGYSNGFGARISWEPFELSAAILSRQKPDKTDAIQGILRDLHSEGYEMMNVIISSGNYSMILTGIGPKTYHGGRVALREKDTIYDKKPFVMFGYNYSDGNVYFGLLPFDTNPEDLDVLDHVADALEMQPIKKSIFESFIDQLEGFDDFLGQKK